VRVALELGEPHYLKRWMSGAVERGAAGLGSLALAAPGSAGAVSEPEYVQLEAAVTPESPQVGDEVTISSVQPCTVADGEDPGQLYAYLYSDTTGEDLYEDLIPLNSDGSWELPVEAAVAEDVYFNAECVPPNWEELFERCFPEEPEDVAALTVDENTETTEDTTPPTVPEEPTGDCTFEYYELEFSIGNPPPATTVPGQPAPGPSPAPPISRTPSYTG
jgi:hypothetical protein